jgi:membrane protein
VAHLAGYALTYGPVGAVVGLMMWFYVTAFAVLTGAELNAALEWFDAGGASDAPGGGGANDGPVRRLQ